MNQKIRQIILLYMRQPSFVILASLGFVSLCAMQALVFWGIQKNLWNDHLLSIPVGPSKHLDILAHKYILGDEILTLIFVLGLWLMFIFGLMIKKQFANDRASLLPGYRLPHVLTAVGLLIFMVGLTIILSQGAMMLSRLFFLQALNISVSLWAIYLFVIIMAITMLLLGYLSIAYLVVVGYVLLTILGQNIIPILQILSSSAITYDAAMALLVGTIILFIYRLFTLKSEHIEYPFLLTWPPQKMIRNQEAFAGGIHNFKIRSLKMFGLSAREPVIPAYYQLRTPWARAGHWGFADKSSAFSLLLLSLVCLPLYYLFLKSPSAESFLNTHIESNFLLLTGAAVLLTIITNYKGMIFWSYDLLKPVRRESFFQQQGLKALRDLFFYWFIIAIYFAIMTDWLRGAEQIGQAHFWAFLFLTFTFSILWLAWLATLSALRNERAVILNGFVMCALIFSEFFWAGSAPMGWIMTNALVCLTLGGLFMKLAFEKWMNKEF